MKKINKKKLQKERLDDLKIDVGLQILELRLLKNKTQGALAKMIGTQQPGIARAERGATIPSLNFLNKIAVALDTVLIPPRFAIVQESEVRYQTDKADFTFRPSPSSYMYSPKPENEVPISNLIDRVEMGSGSTTAGTVLNTN